MWIDNESGKVFNFDKCVFAEITTSQQYPDKYSIELQMNSLSYPILFDEYNSWQEAENSLNNILNILNFKTKK